MMKAYAVFLLTLLSALNARAQFRSDSCGCPIPFGDTGGTFDGRRIPVYADIMQRASPDRKWLAYQVGSGDGGLSYVLNLETGENKRIQITDTYPAEQVNYLNSMFWNPNKPEELALKFSCYIDSNHSGAITNSVANLYLYEPSSGVCTRITPSMYLGYGPANFEFDGWIPSRDPAFDTLVVGLRMKAAPKDTAFYGLYIPQSQSYVPRSLNPIVIAHSQNAKHTISIVDALSGLDTQWFYFDTAQFEAPRSINKMYHASFSPNDKYYAITVDLEGYGPPGDTVFDQVWIGKVGVSLNDWIKVINLQRLYCKYNHWASIDGEFITDSTLAISMHSDGDMSSPLYEITMDGRIVRQLTFPEGAGVAKHSEMLDPLAITLSETPSGFTLQAAGQISGELSVQVFDLLGREIRNYGFPSPAVGSRMAITLVELPEGTYIVRASAGRAVSSFRVRR